MGIFLLITYLLCVWWYDSDWIQDRFEILSLSANDITNIAE